MRRLFDRVGVELAVTDSELGETPDVAVRVVGPVMATPDEPALPAVVVANTVAVQLREEIAVAGVAAGAFASRFV